MARGAGGKLRAVSNTRSSFYWAWVLIGVVVIVVAHVAAYLALGEHVRQLAERDSTAAFLIAGGVPLGIYFFGGLLVVRWAPGRTIQEPAVAGIRALALLFVLQLFVGMLNIFGLLIGAPVSFGMAYFGGWVGELLQKWADQRRSRRAR